MTEQYSKAPLYLSVTKEFNGAHSQRRIHLVTYTVHEKLLLKILWKSSDFIRLMFSYSLATALWYQNAQHYFRYWKREKYPNVFGGLYKFGAVFKRSLRC